MVTNSIPTRTIACCLVGLALVFAAGCATTQSRQTTSIVDYLYPDAKEPVAEQGIPVLNLPMRVGIAFVPEGQWRGSEVLTEARKRQLLDEVAQHFSDRDFVREIEIIPSAYLRPQGGFQNLDQLRTMFGVDVVTLVSYDQTQFTDEGLSSLAYWTIIGAYIVRGEKNSTHTMVDAVVIDIPSRKMLFRSPGKSFVKGAATPVNLSGQLRLDASRGFEAAVVDMIGNLDQELIVFQDRVLRSPEEYRVVHAPDYKGGGGAVGVLEVLLLLLLLLVMLMLVRRRAGPRSS
jgi:rhombotail lipoprotein